MSIVALISNPALEFNHTDSSTAPPQKAIMSVATLVSGPGLECNRMSSSANALDSNLSPNWSPSSEKSFEQGS